MIFVSVGTHEQPFNRLVKAVDDLKKDGVITDEVIIQTGFSTYKPKYCQCQKKAHGSPSHIAFENPSRRLML